MNRVSHSPFALFALLFALVSCSPHAAHDDSGDRGLAGNFEPVSPATHQVLNQDAAVTGGHIEFPPGLSGQEQFDLWHLTEGSDVYPLGWFLKIRSQTSSLKGTRLNERLEEKYGVVPEPVPLAQAHTYPNKWIGVSSSWSEIHDASGDVHLQAGETTEALIRKNVLPSGSESIAMMGVNCTFCHSDVVVVNGKKHFIEGAPNMLNLRGFFQDLFGSTAITMLKPQLLRVFLNDMHVAGDNTAAANAFTAAFKHDLGIDGRLSAIITSDTGKAIIDFVRPGLVEAKQQATLRKVFFQKRPVVAKYLTALLQKTYGLKKVSPELQARMTWLSESLGIDPSIQVTPEGYSRTDAFGRIANWVARVDKPIALDATVSIPPMWALHYKAMFHWNSNTNSVVMRNMGQSFGLGSIRTQPLAKGPEQWDSTTNLANLHKLEVLLYKINVPAYQEYSTEIDLRKAVAGCNTYQTTCAQCHTAPAERVGPEHRLLNARVLPLQAIGTDQTYTYNQATPVDGVAFRTALFNFTGATRNRYYELNKIPLAQQREWEMLDLRGPEMFRDTVLGESRGTGDLSYVNIPAKPAAGYIARDLAGAWATAPYLHNGSVPTMADLLKPSAERPKIFFMGSREFDSKDVGFRHDVSILPPMKGLSKKAALLVVKAKGKLTFAQARLEAACDMFPANCFNVAWTGNSNKGHEGVDFGTTLPQEQKDELVEFMKIIRPPVEYSRNLPPLYRWDGRTCSSIQ